MNEVGGMHLHSFLWGCRVSSAPGYPPSGKMPDGFMVPCHLGHQWIGYMGYWDSSFLLRGGLGFSLQAFQWPGPSLGQGL